ncbi:protein phosphatase inhibitor 2-like [Periplaneta americana]|uniref:protein phosphatase inhibitor 2-like n=1 Tax=Periplaneta americana TaxID=6978 RepID=UPI0037E7BD6D
MAENLGKRPTKGILKSSTSFERPDSALKRKQKETKWDEMNIIATLHPPDKDYGHMKIDEPKTPYTYEIGEEETDGLDANLLAEKIKLSGNEPPKAFARGSGSESESSDEETSEERAKRKVFESKRKAHYNEYYAVKLARKLMHDEENTDPAKEGSSSGRTSPELIFCGVEGCPGHKSGRTERCEMPFSSRGKAGDKHKDGDDVID